MSAARHPAAVYLDSRVLSLLFLGFSAGLPLMLVFSSLSLWLREAGVARETVTMFSWAALAYSFKFVWSPLADTLPLPLLRRLGKRRSWLLLSQVLMMAAAAWMACVNPASADALPYMAAAAVLLGFASATQDIVIDAYRIEAAGGDAGLLTAASATYNAGYRVGMIVSGAGALFLAAKLGSSAEHYSYAAWRQTYLAMAAVMGAGVLTTFCIREPQAGAGFQTASQGAADNLRLLLLFAVSAAAFAAAFAYAGDLLPQAQGAFSKLFWETLRLGASGAAAFAAARLLTAAKLVSADLVRATWVSPVADFFHRYGRAALLLLALIGMYRVSDIVAGVVANVFYQDMGFAKEEIAAAVKTFGVVMAVAGGLLGGLLSQRFSLMKMMTAGAVLASATNLLFVALSYRGHDVLFLYLAVGCDNLASGLAGAVFVAFLSSLTSIRFTAVQYAVLSSLMTLLPKTLGGYSGAMVQNIGYPGFFLFTALLGVPVLLLLWLTDQYVYRPSENTQNQNKENT